MHVIDGFQPFHKWIFELPLIIDDTSICKSNIEKLVVLVVLVSLCIFIDLASIPLIELASEKNLAFRLD